MDVAADAVAGGTQIGRRRLALVALQFDNIIAHSAAGAEMPAQSPRQELKILGATLAGQQGHFLAAPPLALAMQNEISCCWSPMLRRFRVCRPRRQADTRQRVERVRREVCTVL